MDLQVLALVKCSMPETYFLEKSKTMVCQIGRRRERISEYDDNIDAFRNSMIFESIDQLLPLRALDKMQTIGFSKGDSETYEGIKEKVLEALKSQFRPEFLNRLDDVIVFDVLSKTAIKEIVNIQVDIIKKRLAEKDIELTKPFLRCSQLHPRTWF